MTTLTEILKEPDATPEVRRYALDTLADIGPNARPALPQITEALSHESPAVRLSAARAVSRVDRKGPTATDTVLAILEDPASPLELAARPSIPWPTSVPSAKAAPLLTRLLADPSPYVHIKAARALWQIEHQALPIIDVLRHVAGLSGAEGPGQPGRADVGGLSPRRNRTGSQDCLSRPGEGDSRIRTTASANRSP